MRIMVLTTWYPSVENPVQAVFVRRHVEAISRRHEVSVLHFASPGTEPQPSTRPSLRVEHLDWDLSAPGALVRAMRAARDRVKDFQPDVIHTMGFSSLAVGLGASRGLPWVHTEHWSGVTEPRSAGPLWNAARAARHLLRRPDAVTVVSTDMAGQVERFARPGRLHVVGNVVDTADPQPRAATDDLRLLAVGGLNAIKDPALAVRIVAELHRRGRPVTLRWAGAGPLEDEVRALAASLGVTDRVQLLGQVAPPDLAQHHAWSTEFVLPTRHETFCVAAAEALGHGRPVVVGATGGQRDFVSAANGALVESRDPATWADAVIDVRSRLGDVPPEALSRQIAEKFSPEAIGDAFDDVYRTVLA